VAESLQVIARQRSAAPRHRRGLLSSGDAVCGPPELGLLSVQGAERRAISRVVGVVREVAASPRQSQGNYALQAGGGSRCPFYREVISESEVVSGLAGLPPAQVPSSA
jgi:hypothetical protein